MTVVEATGERGRTPSDPIEVRFVPPVTVRGVVVDVDARPIVGATVRTRRGIVGPIWGHGRVADEWEWTCETESAGRFSFTGPPPFSPVNLTADHPAYPEVQESVRTNLDGAEARIVLQVGNALVGRVERSSDGSPVEGATVQADENHVAITEGDGRFRLEGLPDQVHLKVRAPGLVEVEVFNIPVTAGGVRLVRLSAGASISGRVVDSTGVPVPFANVHGFSPTLDGSYPEGTRASSHRPRCEADAEGRFTLSAVAEGHWHLSAAPHDMEPADRWYLGKRVRTGESDITLTARGLTGVAFRVLDRETGEPISPTRCFGPTGSEGGPNANASTFLALRPGTPGTIGVSAAGYVPEIRNGVVIAAGEIREEVFHLARASDLHGRLVDERSQAIPRATLVLRPEALTDQDSVDVTTVTDSEGAFIARGVVPGNWRIVSCSVFGVNGAEERLLVVTPPDLSLDPSDTEATLVAVPPGGRAVVRGYVTLWENTLRAAVIVRPHGIRVPVDKHGFFVAEGVPAGPAAIALECDRGHHGTITEGIGEVEVPEVGTLDVDLRKRP